MYVICRRTFARPAKTIDREKKKQEFNFTSDNFAGIIVSLNLMMGAWRESASILNANFLPSLSSRGLINEIGGEFDRVFVGRANDSSSFIPSRQSS